MKDLHYWDESSRRRFVDAVHKMWVGKMKVGVL